MSQLPPFTINLLIILSFILLLIIIFWIMPNKKSYTVVKRLKELLQALPISQIYLIINDSLNRKNKSE